MSSHSTVQNDDDTQAIIHIEPDGDVSSGRVDLACNENKEQDVMELPKRQRKLPKRLEDYDLS